MITQPHPRIEVFSDIVDFARRMANVILYLLFSPWYGGASIMASAIPRLPLDYATALQHRGQSAGEDSDVMLRGHKWLRRAARLMISALGSHGRRALQ
jgi:hypothetical protein